MIDTILCALSLVHLVTFSKRYADYRFTARSRDTLATIVTVPELHGARRPRLSPGTWPPRLRDVSAFLTSLGNSDDALTNEQDTDAVLRTRT